MKKSIMLLFVFVIAFGIIAAGCGSNNDTSNANDSGSAAGAETIKVATDAAYAPMEFMDKGKIVGFDADLLDAVMEEAGLDYELVNTGWDTMLESVKQGTEYEVGISSVSITEDRKITYDYTVPYFESTNMILVNEDSAIQNANDLKDKKVAVQVATTADELMSNIMGQDNTNLKRFDTNTLAIQELASNGVDAVVADIAIVREYIKNNPDKKLKGLLDETNFTPEFYGILLTKGSDLKAKLDPAVKKVIESGKYAEIYKEWFGEEPDTQALLDQM